MQTTTKPPHGKFGPPHMPQGEGEGGLLYASWRSSNAQIMVLDHDLRIVLWSKGMRKAVSGYEPAYGLAVTALPFPSDEHLAKMVISLVSTWITLGLCALKSSARERSTLPLTPPHPRLPTSL